VDEVDLKFSYGSRLPVPSPKLMVLFNRFLSFCASWSRQPKFQHTPYKGPQGDIPIQPTTYKPYTMSTSPGGKRKPSASPQVSRTTSSNDIMTQDGFSKIETKEERRKRKKVEKRRPQFQFDMSAFRSGKKVGMAVSTLFLLATVLECEA
jgi:hypothetical protein